MSIQPAHDESEGVRKGEDDKKESARKTTADKKSADEDAPNIQESNKEESQVPEGEKDALEAAVVSKDVESEKDDHKFVPELAVNGVPQPAAVPVEKTMTEAEKLCKSKVRSLDYGLGRLLTA